jgi:hypothetical protein
MSNLTLEIYPSDCVGDSSAKHNYNSLVLDTTICNLSSQFFLVDNNFTTVFNDFSSNLSNFNTFAQQFNDPSAYNLANATTNLLSSYWSKNEFTVHYPLNIFTINNLSCPTINTPDSTLQSLANVFLNNNYPATNYSTNTIANIIFFLYSVPVDPNNPNNLQTTISSPEFSYLVRNMNISIIRKDIHFGNGKIFKFKNSGTGSWTYFSTDAGSALSAINDFIVYPTQPPQNRITIPPVGNGSRSVISLTVNENTFNYDVYQATLNSGLYVNGFTDVFITIANNVTIGSTSPAIPSLIVSSALTQNIGFVAGDTVTIINNGTIIGAGGDGGNGQNWGSSLAVANNGSAGGDAILLQYLTTIENNGTIAGGGGGGAGGYIGTILQNTFDPTKSIANLYGGGGGGGGAGVVAGGYGYGGTGFNDITQITNKASNSLKSVDIALINSGTLNGSNGNSGNSTTGGLGGTSAGQSNTSSNQTIGGSGGGLGAAGTSTGPIVVSGGQQTQYPPRGGVAGNYINGKNYLQFSTQGLVYGNII